ncbi:MAG: 1-deoxy-D-xylulose-5-phosphate synthase [Kiritimatiellae bacterium]|nr:1-deoxy-D-xylulose-5-phosphate synthase [Kiritimatiellia bacterium]
MMTALDIRTRILDAVSKNGGHLASSLGAVELALALAETFDPEKDRIVWDVGHQAYAWKILTGRADRFNTLRKLGGISGFPNPAESRADAAVAGHAGVAISVAEGLAAARTARGGDEWVVAVVGDASLSNGTSLEALNNCVTAGGKIIVILNDNEMSISKPTGALSRHLGRLIAGRRYNRVKAAVKAVEKAFGVSFLNKPIRRIKAFVKRMLIGHAYFEQMGLRYMGPVDGHDVAAIKTALEVAKRDRRSVLLHVVTVKGRGYAPAVKDPEKWHGVGAFTIAASPDDGLSSAPVEKKKTWSDVFGEAICAAAEKDERIVALTAAMKDGTGLTEFAAKFPKRFKDVGISEGHMVAYAAGLAAGGMRPVVAIYSTFLQRAVDQIMHDVCIAKLPVVFCVDRAGVVGADGVTHQGVFDIALLRALPNLTICQPKDAADLKALLDEALVREGPTVIRYPRGVAGHSPALAASVPAFPIGSDGRAAPGQPKYAIWATGDWYGKACDVAARVGGVAVHARYLKPFDAALLQRQRAAGLTIVSLENGSVAGGFGEAIGADVKFGWPDEFIPHGAPAELERKYGLDAETITEVLTHGNGTR